MLGAPPSCACADFFCVRCGVCALAELEKERAAAREMSDSQREKLVAATSKLAAARSELDAAHADAASAQGAAQRAETERAAALQLVEKASAALEEAQQAKAEQATTLEQLRADLLRAEQRTAALAAEVGDRELRSALALSTVPVQSGASCEPRACAVHSACDGGGGRTRCSAGGS